MRFPAAVLLALLPAAACGDAGDDSAPAADAAPDSGSTGAALAWDTLQDTTQVVASIEGLQGPEAVRYDPDQDVWFVANFGERADDVRDGNGFIARIDAETGAVESLRFAVGTEARPLHQPRGMFITGDTLWAADVDGVHGFDRRTGQPMVFRDMTSFEPGFLNDIAQGPGGALYITDTGRSAVYRMAGESVSEAIVDSTLANPNGITWDSARNAMVLVPWNPGGHVRLWSPGEATTETLGSATPGRYDGVEAVDRRLLIASQTDSTLRLVDGGASRAVIRVRGAPADIGVDTRRRRVAVPYIALNRVDIWQMPGA